MDVQPANARFGVPIRRAQPVPPPDEPIRFERALQDEDGQVAIVIRPNDVIWKFTRIRPGVLRCLNCKLMQVQRNLRMARGNAQQPEFPPLPVRNFPYDMVNDEARWRFDPTDENWHNVACLRAPLSTSQHAVDMAMSEAREATEDIAPEPFKLFRRASYHGLNEMCQRYDVDIELAMGKWPRWDEVKNGFNRRRNNSIPAIRGIGDIPPAYMFTKLGNIVAPQHPLYHQPFVRLARVELPHFILCASPAAITHLVTRCQVAIGDATFKVAPQAADDAPNFHQVYTSDGHFQKFGKFA